ncbi:MAG: hypothetical protein MRY75_16075 [Marivita sp.]|uniref:hypothetical protein n=1 Tax=Marivita sp. TaxID=2003365 RepID=UPI0025C4E11C|nr:hypothetical protein [Marivita sp.]MCI5112069.1 hypothetical protein [Marivita sp.]
MQEMPVVTDLPDDMLTAIGQVIVEYAFLELQLSRIIYDLLAVDPKAGRLAVREPRASDRLDVIFDLCALRGVSIEEEKNPLKKALEFSVSQRDRIAHGIWVFDEESGDHMLRITRGSWPKSPGEKRRRKRIVEPEAVTLTPQNIFDIAVTINHASRYAVQMREEIQAQLRSSHEK